MKQLLAMIWLGLMSAATNAATVTITFDELPLSCTRPPFSETCTVTTEGYNFVSQLGVSDSYDGVSGGNKVIRGVSAQNDFGGYGDYVFIERADGQAFSLNAADVIGFESYYATSDAGNFNSSGGPSLAELGTGAWLNITSVTFQGSTGYFAQIYVDNVTVSTVPVPAAVWLFASGLGLLGWMKRTAV